MDDYIRKPKVFRVVSEKTGVPEGYRNPPGEIMGLMGLSGERERAGLGQAARPSPSGPNWTRRRGQRPPFLLPLPLPFPLLVGVGKGGTLLLLGGGFLLLGTPTRSGRPPPCSSIYGGRGHPRTHKLIIDLLVVWGAPLHHNPPQSYCSVV